MYGSGGIKSMIDSLRNNKMLLRRKGHFEKENTFLNLSKGHFKTDRRKIKTKKASPEILKKIRTSAISRRRKFVITYLILIMIGVSYITYTIVKIYKEDKSQTSVVLSTEKSVKENNFLVLVKKGDGWFKERKWDAALFYYNKAKVIFPNEYSINYRIAQTMSIKCEKKYLQCRETKAVLDSLFEKYPEKFKELNTIKERLSYEY
jgi:hypothetical protein